MLGAAGALTLVTLTGLAAGLAREWLLVAAWGAGAQADGFLVAAFVPEAVRTVLAGGLLSSAALALWQAEAADRRPVWLGGMSTLVLGVAVCAALLLSLAAPLWVRLIGPGLPPDAVQRAGLTLAVLAWSLPGMALQAIWSVPLQAAGRFVTAGLGSLLYNLPAVVYLAWARAEAQPQTLAWTFVGGSAAMAAVLLPGAWQAGWRPSTLGRWPGAQARALGARLAPLVGSALLSQGLALLERIVASYLGEGVVTVLNLARKLVNLPLLALMAVNQVLLGLMSRGGVTERLALLRQGLGLVTVVSVPAAIGLMLAAPALVHVLFPAVQGTEVLAPVLGWYAVSLVVASWLQLGVRYCHASGDTHLPFACELRGSVVQALALAGLGALWGVTGMAVSILVGLLVQGGLLWWRAGLRGRVPMLSLVGTSTLALLAAGAWGPAALAPWQAQPALVLAAATGIATLALILLALWWQPWRPARP